MRRPRPPPRARRLRRVPRARSSPRRPSPRRDEPLTLPARRLLDRPRARASAKRAPRVQRALLSAVRGGATRKKPRRGGFFFVADSGAEDEPMSAAAAPRPGASLRVVVPRRERADVRDGPVRVYAVVHARGEGLPAEAEADVGPRGGIRKARLGRHPEEHVRGMTPIAGEDEVPDATISATGDVAAPRARDARGARVPASERLGARDGGDGEGRDDRGSTAARDRGGWVVGKASGGRKRTRARSRRAPLVAARTRGTAPG